MSQRISKPIYTEWYDGPLRSVSLVEFDDGDKMIQVDTPMATVGERYTIGYDENVRDVMVRFDREELQSMIDLLDGKPIKDYRDDEQMPEFECDTNAGPCACGDLHVDGLAK